MFKVRLRYSKLGPAAYISHLDLMKTLQRSLRRAGLPVRYSEGFNPHIILSILAPLSTGYESRGDLCDFELLDQAPYPEIVSRLNTALPPGLCALEAGPVGRPASKIAFGSFEIRYPGSHDPVVMAALFDQPILLDKKSKRGSREVDITGYFREKPVFAPAQGGTLCSVTLKLGDDPLNPMYVTKALENAGLIDPATPPDYVRTALLDQEGELF